MKTKRLLDSYALLAYLNGEKGAERVRALLADAEKTGQPLLMNEINIGETYYILARARGRDKADYFLDSIFQALPISPLSNDLPSVVAAATIKADHPLSFADCFAAATAIREGAILVTGDAEFRAVEGDVKIEWLGA